MTEQNPSPADPRQEGGNRVPEKNAGALKQLEKERLERDISQALESLRGSLSAPQVAALLEKLANAEARRGLEGLKSDLEREKTLAGEKVSDETSVAILKLIADVQKATQLDISELRLEVTRVNPSPHWEPNPEIYPTNKVAPVRGLETRRLGKNVVMDIAGVLAGTLDSAAAVIKLLVALLQDVFFLPRDVLRALRKDPTTKGDSGKKAA